MDENTDGQDSGSVKGKLCSRKVKRNSSVDTILIYKITTVCLVRQPMPVMRAKKAQDCFEKKKKKFKSGSPEPGSAQNGGG